MINSKIIDILKTFSREEMKRFSEFLVSPYHNKNKKALQLFEILSAHHPDFDNKNLTKEKLFLKIFHTDKKAYNDASVRNLLSDLMILAEKFLAFNRFEKERFDTDLSFLRETADRKIHSLFEKKIRQTEEASGRTEFEGEEQFYRKFLLEELRSSSSQYSDDLKLYKNNSYLKASEYLSYYFLIKLFKFVNFFEFQKLYNIDPGSNFALKLLKGIDLEKIFDSKEPVAGSENDLKILNVYYRMYLSVTHPDNDDHYFDFKKNLFENEELLSNLEKLGLYICLSNSCVRKIDSGKNEFSKECFDIYMLMFEKDLYNSYPGYFPMSAFSTVLHTGLASGELVKIESFINSYSQKLNPEHKSDAVSYSMAQLHFHRKDFGKALEYISRTDTEFSQLKFLLKILSLKIYYETEDYESLYYVSDSFQHFLNKNKLVGQNYKTDFGNFIRILDLLVKYRSLKDEKMLHKINEQLDKRSTAGRKWILEKINEIKSPGSG